MKMKLISIVIPAYNEERAIGKTLKLINNVIEKFTKKNKNYSFEVVVVNNNSTDRTGEIAKRHNARVVFERKKGYGNAYKAGLKSAKGDIIITGDADATYPFEDIPRFLSLLKKDNLDFINTNRFAHLEKNSMPFLNNIGNRILTLTLNLLYGYPVKDSQSGMWIFKRKVLNKMNFDIMSKGMPFSQEIKIYALHNKFRFKEIPITYRERIGAKKLNTFKDGWDNLVNLIKFKKKLSRR